MNIKYQAEPANFSVDICFIRITNTINKHQINRKHFSVECRQASCQKYQPIQTLEISNKVVGLTKISKQSEQYN